MNPKDAEFCAEVADRMRPYMVGIGPERQGAVLAELVSVWLAGHMAEDSLPGDPETDKLRHALFDVWTNAVWMLTTVNEMMLREQYGLPTKEH